ncbi:restriction endonuclease subunit S [Bifidobacterium mongoliense]|uniref:restriction endonuclease subunit S n=1 Tax=Bifidobacterium mongoliense TaxID=518643 RepID=UPI0030EF5EF9
MTDDTSRVPKLRFPGFTGAWEQRKVGELLTERNKQEPASDDYPLMAFIANEGVAPKGDRYDRSALVSDSKNKKYKKTELGDFIYSSNNLETGSIGLNRYGRASISPVYSIFHPTNVADSNFLGRRLVRRDFINAMVRWRQGVVYGQWRIHESDFIKIQLSVPVIEEQRAIGTFLDTFDDLITLHQRKLSHLRELKRGLLQKMFPKSGEDRPEVRFPGFADAWEQRKFNDLFNPVRNNSLSRAMLNNFSGDVRSIHYGDVLIRYGAITDCRDATIPFISRSQSSDFSEELLNDGDVLFADAAEDQTVGKVTEVEGISGTPVVAGLHILACRPKVTMGLGYLAYYLNSPAFHGSLLPLMQGTKVLSISRSILAETRVYYPVQLRERQLLGTFFKQLDDLITLHQRKLSHLQQQRKALLQQMFV